MTSSLHHSRGIACALPPGSVAPEWGCYIRSCFLSLHRIIESKFMNIREREIILRLNSKNPDVRNRQVSELFYGKGEDTRRLREEFNKIIRYCFQGPKYRGMHDDIYSTLVSLVCEAIWSAREDKFEEAQNLEAYFFRMARNCANGKRRFIDQALGINDREESLEGEGFKQPVGEDPRDDGGDDLLIILTFGRSDISSDRSRKELAKELVERYISSIANDNYRTVLYAVDIWKWPHERIEKELGIDNIDQAHRRAKLALIRAALPDIRKCCGEFFRHHRDCVSADDAAILDRFFAGEDRVPRKAVSVAYSNLLKVVKRERVAFLKEMKRRAREEKAALKAEKEAEKEKARRGKCTPKINEE